jgi:Cu2+-exporting ATPase
MSADPHAAVLASALAPATATPCTHCGLAVPRGLLRPDSAEQFCCQGCRTVYELIHGCGLEQYYRLRARAEAKPTRATERSYGGFDDATFLARHCQPTPNGRLTAEFYVEGVHCAACLWLIEKLPRVVPGVVEARLDVARARVRVTWDPQSVALSAVARGLDHLGYPPHPARDTAARALRQAEDRRFLVRIGVAAALMGNVMTLAVALYAGAFSGMEDDLATYFRHVSAGLGLLALAWPGNLFFRNALHALRTRSPHLDIPIALALLVGGVMGIVNTATGRGETYFDSLTMLVFLLLLGRWFELRQQRRTADALELLYALTPTTARRVRGEQVEEVASETLERDDLVEVRAGETVPADGTVASGDSELDVAWLTGEPQPVSVTRGAPVLAGTVNLTAPLRVRVSATGLETRAGRLSRLVEEAARTRPAIVCFANRIAGAFTFIVIAVALGTFAGWLPFDAARGADAATAVLIVACPCALGLAVPLAFTAAIGRAARRGVLVRTGCVFEALAGVGKVLLDKTGTVTEGRIRLTEWHASPPAARWVAALETQSAHPVARALVAGLAARAPAPGPDDLPAAAVEQATSSGIVGVVEGARVIVGAPSFVRGRGAQLSAEFAAAEQGVVGAGLTPVLAARDGEVVAVAGLGDPVRPESAAVVRDLQACGWEVSLLSGDHPQVVAAVSRQLGLPPGRACGGATPEDKLAQVVALRERGPVVMVGDGVNDTAALSAATVGIAVRGGAEASLAAADVYLGRPGLESLVALIRAARRTRRSLHLCFAASLGYNLIGVSLAAAGLICPLIAAVLMPLSSFSVVALVLARRTFEDTQCR